jgi:hypothetical protein
MKYSQFFLPLESVHRQFVHKRASSSLLFLFFSTFLVILLSFGLTHIVSATNLKKNRGKKACRFCDRERDNEEEKRKSCCWKNGEKPRKEG